jgi:hypothetical protein
MLPRALAVLLLLPVSAAAQVLLPGAGGQRFVDFSEELAHPGAVVAIGTLGKWKEGKRERLADGQLGGGGQVASVSGTQYFKVPVTAVLEARAVLHGNGDDVAVALDVQLARLPDGKERRQVAGGAPFAEGTLALFVLAPRGKRGHDVRHVIVFDKTVATAADAEGAFADTMRDHYAVNRRIHELSVALAAVDAAKNDAARAPALAALRDRLAAKVELKDPKNDALLAQHVAPLERRAKERLAGSGEGAPAAGR